MDLQQWREQQAGGEQFVTPSGLTVRIRQASLLDLAVQGRIPDTLTGMVEALLERERVKLDLENFAEYEATVNVVVKANVVEPRIADEASDTALAVDELPMSDRISIFNHANGAALRLRPFRQQPEADADPA